MDIPPRDPFAGTVRVALRRARILWWRGGVPVPVRGQIPSWQSTVQGLRRCACPREDRHILPRRSVPMLARAPGEVRRMRAPGRPPKNKTPRAVRLRGFEQ